MKIYDCFLFNDENHILEIRLNELNKYVDYFVIVEFGQNHQGKIKGQKINSKLINKFGDKIRYYYIPKFDEKLNAWEKESFQRNQIEKGLLDARSEDIIIISDIDEIPKLNEFDFKNIGDWVYAFAQKHSMYKLNLFRANKKSFWIGSKLCKKKILKSPQWLRALKVQKKYSFFRIDKYFSKTYYSKFKIIDDGGWHFGWLRNCDQIIEKINSYAHTEHNIKIYNDRNYIQNCIDRKISFLDSKDTLTLEKNTENLPKYIHKNFDKYSEWLA